MRYILETSNESVFLFNKIMKSYIVKKTQRRPSLKRDKSLQS